MSPSLPVLLKTLIKPTAKKDKGKKTRRPITPCSSDEGLGHGSSSGAGGAQSRAPHVQTCGFWKIPWELRRRILELAFFGHEETTPGARFIHVNLVRKDFVSYRTRFTGNTQLVSFHIEGSGDSPGTIGAKKSKKIPVSANFLFDEESLLKEDAVQLVTCSFPEKELEEHQTRDVPRHRCPLYEHHCEEHGEPRYYDMTPCRNKGPVIFCSWLRACRQAYMDGMATIYASANTIQIGNPTLLLHLPLFLPVHRLANVTNANITIDLAHREVTRVPDPDFRRGHYATLASRIPAAFPRLRTLHLGVIFEELYNMAWKLSIHLVSEADRDATVSRLLGPIDQVCRQLSSTLRYFVLSLPRSYHWLAMVSGMRHGGFKLEADWAGRHDSWRGLPDLTRPSSSSSSSSSSPPPPPRENQFGGFSHLTSGALLEEWHRHAHIPDEWCTVAQGQLPDSVRKFPSTHAAFWRNVFADGADGTGPRTTGYWVEWCGHVGDMGNCDLPHRVDPATSSRPAGGLPCARRSRKPTREEAQEKRRRQVVAFKRRLKGLPY
ncbi:hypothetical protein MKZ38_003183 [Zalerion maritima]|uniref:Uncharacterized protein n=1 Tax=Zalerion maritima TaxID=339359 RepID=A0AAD5S6J7_9PEZI|nr:hypothetical protein MKZ38_003183 [Zalerion maritima]